MSEELIASTIETFKPYGKLMPSLDPKYFKRPPIKFLALTVAALHKKTGFGKGMFTEDQLKGNLPERDDKLNFFGQLKKYTEVVLGESIDVEPREIAAGKEVDKTLTFMQAFARAAEHPKVPFDKALAQLKPDAAPAAGGDDEEARKKELERRKRAELEKRKREEAERKKKEEAERKKKEASESKQEGGEQKQEGGEKKDDDEEERKRKEHERKKREELERRKKEEAERRKKEEAERRKKEEAERKRREEAERKKREEEVEDVTDEAAPAKTSGKAPPRAREEVNVVVDAVVPEVIKEDDGDDQADDVFVEDDARGTGDAGEGEGKLTKDIRDAMMKMGPKQGGKDSMDDADSFKQGIERAKILLQYLARSAQPLDTLIQFSQEDLGNMENEYKRWTAECAKQQRALEDERQATEKQLTELRAKSDELDKDIVRQEGKLRSIKAAAFLKEGDLMKQFASLCG